MEYQWVFTEINPGQAPINIGKSDGKAQDDYRTACDEIKVLCILS